MKSALVIGASRGIGRQLALSLANDGYRVGVASKTLTPVENLPGSVEEVVADINRRHGASRAIPLQCNVRDVEQIKISVSKCIESFGHLDAVVYNAGAILWKPVLETPLKRFDLLQEVNIRGSYALVQAVLPHFLERKTGRIILVAPPIYTRFFRGKTPYAMGKVGMTILVNGLSHELRGTGVSISALWPATGIKSHVTTVKDFPESSLRLPTIFADATLAILNEKTDRHNGRALIDEDLLREYGVTDFTKYRCVATVEPPRMMPRMFPSLLVAEEEITPLVDNSKL